MLARPMLRRMEYDRSELLKSWDVRSSHDIIYIDLLSNHIPPSHR